LDFCDGLSAFGTRGQLRDLACLVDDLFVARIGRADLRPALLGRSARSKLATVLSLARGMGPAVARVMGPGDGHRRPANVMPQI